MCISCTRGLCISCTYHVNLLHLDVQLLHYQVSGYTRWIAYLQAQCESSL